MGRRDEAADLLKSGLSPSAIAKRMGVTTSTVIGYLFQYVGRGLLKRSDIVLSINPKARKAIEGFFAKGRPRSNSGIERALQRMNIQIEYDELFLYLQLRRSRFDLGDMYEYLRELELYLHSFIREVLELNFANEWWRMGIPKEVRKECAAIFEEDDVPGTHPYNCVTLLNLRKTFDRNWNLFQKYLPKEDAKDKNRFLGKLAKANLIRNKVMHPSKQLEVTDEDFEFIKQLLSRLSKVRPVVRHLQNLQIPIQ